VRTEKIRIETAIANEFWHGGGGNYIFVDGHAKFHRADQTITDLEENCMWGHPSAGDHKLHLQWRDKRAQTYR
jgi:prepilin-type processing-associated H-X9-DG protein